MRVLSGMAYKIERYKVQVGRVHCSYLRPTTVCLIPGHIRHRLDVELLSVTVLGRRSNAEHYLLVTSTAFRLSVRNDNVSAMYCSIRPQTVDLGPQRCFSCEVEEVVSR